MKLWKHEPTAELLQGISANTLVEHLGIEFIAVGDDYIKAKMLVDARTVQPMRILHGGASVALAETLGSIASTLCIEDFQKKTAVGLAINANHLKAVREGNFVIGKVSPIRIGRTVHVWNIEIFNSEEELTCISRLTISIIDNKF